MTTITASLFDAFLKCPTQCWLRARNETPSGNTYAEWVQAQNESYRAAEIELLLAQTPLSESARSPSAENLKTAKWRLAVDLEVQTPESPRSSRHEEALNSSWLQELDLAEGGFRRKRPAIGSTRCPSSRWSLFTSAATNAKVAAEVTRL